MNNEALESQLIDYIDGKLSETERKQVEVELARNAEVYKLYEQLKEVMRVMDQSSRLEPSSKLRESFGENLEREIDQQKTRRLIPFSSMMFRVAAAITLLVLGVSAGYFISKYQRQQEELARVKHQVEETKQLMMSLLDNQQSASKRVLGATVALKEIKTLDNDILNALVNAMNEDPNTNVRLAALDALGKFRQQPAVRKALIAGLTTQKDPLVQIALIRLLVEMNEKSTIQQLEHITNDEDAIKEVKDEAHAGLLRLS